MSIASTIREWMETECPVLDEFTELFLDYIDADKSYMIEFTPADPIVKRYTDGTTIRRKQFVFCSKVIYDSIENIDTSEFFEDFSEWMEECNRTSNLPTLGNNKISKSIKALTDGYLFDETGKMGQYRIQCEFQYFQMEDN